MTAAARSSSKRTGSSTGTVLLVEDDRDEVAVALRAIERSDVEARVEVARDGQQALEALGLDAPREADALSPSVVFLDLKMPRVDGWEVLRRMRDDPRTADVPVVVLSGSDRPEDVRRSYALGANSFLLKRFDPRGPGRYFAEAVRYWIDLNLDPPPDAPTSDPRERSPREPRERTTE